MAEGALGELYGRLNVRANALDRLLHLFSDLSDPRARLRELLDIAVEAVPCEASSVLVVTGEDGEMTFAAASGPVADRILGRKLPAGAGIAGACAADRKTIAVSDVASDPRFAREISESFGFETRSLLAAPVLNRGRLGGVLELVNREGGDNWARHEVELIERIARVAGSLLDAVGDGA